MTVRLVGGRDLVLDVSPRPGEDLAHLSRRLAGTPVRAELIVAAVKGQDLAAQSGAYRVPLPLLGPDYRAVVLRNVFPDDGLDGPDWVHVARRSALPIYDEGLWQVALWFTGDGAKFVDLQRANALDGPELAAGQRVRVPGDLLDPALAWKPTSDDGTLVYGKDADGEYAGYRLKSGEALYSAVVLRYTGRTAAEDVDGLAKAIAARSDVRDLTDIPTGWIMKIPRELLEPEFLPKGDPKRKTRDKAEAEMEAELAASPPTPPAPKGLKGVVFILDPGHGGRDPGTMNNGIWEHDYVFDVASRVKREIESKTAAKVYLTLDDPATGPVPSSKDPLPENRKRTVLTTPPFLAEGADETPIAVNLRWYLANALFRRAVRDGANPDRIVFVSLHADARHPSLRGAMVYVPGAKFREGTMGSTSSTYMRFEEVREKPRLSFTRKERLRSEAVSRKLAAALVRELKRSDLPVQAYQPVRDRVIRGREVWLPAVLKGNAVPNKVLIEMVNLNNPEDAALLGRAADRDRLSKALVAGLTSYLGGGAGKGAPARRGASR